MLKFSKNILLAIIIIMLFFLLGEVSARVYDKIRGLNIDIHVYGSNVIQDSRFLEYSFKPNSAQKDPTVQDYKINSLGFFSEEFEINKPPGTFRILCLGASTTLSGNYPKKLNDILKQRYPDKKIEVINCAVHGWSTTHNLINYIIRLTYLEPDLAIFYFCPEPTHSQKNGYFSDLDKINYFKIGFLKRHSVFYNIVRNRLLRFKIWVEEFHWRRQVNRDFKEMLAQEKTTAHTTDIYTDIFRTNIENLIILIKAKGGNVLLSTFTTSYIEDMTRERYLHAEYPFRHIYLYQKIVDIDNSIIRELAKKYSLPLCDNALNMPKELDNFYDFIHLTHTGGRQLAKNIADVIINHNLIKH